MKKIFSGIIALVLTTTLFAQNKDLKRDKREQRKEKVNALIKQEEEGVITYSKHFLGGVKLTTDGYGAFLEIGRAQSIKKSLLFQLEITERKHPKEYKQYDPNLTVLEPIIYGKINYVYPVKLGVQQQFLLGNKSNKNGVSISGNIGGGLTLSLLRPYLVEVQDNNGDKKYVGYESADSALYLNGPYYAGPNLGTGFNKLKVTPGVYIKPALRFDYGRYNEVISAVEVGMTAEYYSKEIPQMIYNKPKKFFYGAYVSVLFGKRK